ncbi:relaxase/mobilization nuclease domain-containing protein [Citricoccus sp. I39-566]|uniref:relaxase/mobilization nuclease domain-containing protein n=1 Tax=Citricoccus sp. I39-566 TaxID=3073268 RepID=UPI00286BB355|nr:relaxase/mobilization nuclease domain-containing protein [Citricoccus sp. I39-566]WMY80010.1 relaxase/mobilization nuclease domain-containing protein [Citricoccus sp. I39-566]
MMPNVVRGGRMVGLMSYLVGPGRSNEHTAPMIVGGDDRVLIEFEPGQELSVADGQRIGAILDAPRHAHGTEVKAPVYAWDENTQRKVKVGEKDGHVWHCSLSLAKGDREVSKDEWGAIASEFVERMGFIDPDGAKSSRWVAIHHGTSKAGNDHIHLAVQLVREDGTKANIHHDYHRAQTVCGELEKEHGLAVLESRQVARGLSGDKPAEVTRAAAEGYPQAPRPELRRRLRTALATAATPSQYIERLGELNVRVAPSFAAGSTTQIRGYKVALGEAQEAVWYSPSKLDATLGWPNVLRRFDGAGREPAEALLASLHNSVKRDWSSVQVGAFDPGQVEKLLSGKTGTGPDDLATIYARLSMHIERGKPGAFSQLSEQYARAAQGKGNVAHAVRLGARFAAKDPTRGWLAVLAQANRLSRAMTAQSLAAHRPQLAVRTAALMRTVDAISAQHTATAGQATGRARPRMGGQQFTRPRPETGMDR